MRRSALVVLTAALLTSSRLGMAYAESRHGVTEARHGAVRPCDEAPGLNVLYRFGTGSPPTAPPLITPDGTTYVGTREGYVHALHADGSYHWSYTVNGTVTGRLARTDGGVLVPTPRRIYALRPDGRLLWVFNSPVTIRGGLARDGAGRFHFASEDGRVFWLSGRGALLGHIPGRSRVSALPTELADGAIAFGRADGSVIVSAKSGVSRFKLDTGVTAVLGCPGARACAITDGRLHALTPKAEPSVRARALRAADAGSWLAVLTPDDRLELFRGAAPSASFSIELPSPAAAAPSIDAEGTSYVPLREGALLAVSRTGTVSACVRIASSPLGQPTLDPARRRVLVTANEGTLAAIQLK